MLSVSRMRILRIFCLTFVLILLFASCKHAYPQYHAWRESAFRVTLSGSLHGLAIEAEGEVVPLTEGGWLLRLTYRAPSVLSGLSCAARLSREMTLSTPSLSLGELSLSPSPSAAEALLAPLLCLLREEEPVTVEKTREGYLLVLGDGAQLTLVSTPQGLFPRRYLSKELSLDVLPTE